MTRSEKRPGRRQRRLHFGGYLCEPTGTEVGRTTKPADSMPLDLGLWHAESDSLMWNWKFWKLNRPQTEYQREFSPETEVCSLPRLCRGNNGPSIVKNSLYCSHSGGFSGENREQPITRRPVNPLCKGNAILTSRNFRVALAHLSNSQRKTNISALFPGFHNNARRSEFARCGNTRKPVG